MIRFRRDIIIILAVTIFAFLFAYRFDLLDLIGNVIGTIPHRLFDALIFAMFVLALILAFFSYRHDQDLQASREKLRATLETIPNFVMNVDRSGTLHYINRTLPQFTVESVIGTSIYDYVDKQFWPAMRTCFEEVFQTGQPGQYQVDYSDEHGYQIAFDTRVGPIFSLDDQVAALTVCSTDVTQRKEAETQLRESQSLLQSTLDALTTHIAILDDSGNILDVNRAWRGFTEANAGNNQLCGVGANYLEVCDNAEIDHATIVKQGIREVISQQRQQYTLEYACHSPDQKRWFIMNVTRFESVGDCRIVIAHENITSRKLAEIELNEHQLQLRTILDAAPIYIWHKDNKNTILRCNKMAAESRGVSVQEMEGQPVRTFYPEEADDYFQDDLDVMQSGQAKLGIVEHLQTASGDKFWIQTNKAPYFDPAGHVTGVVVAAQDITELKEAQESLAQRYIYEEGLAQCSQSLLMDHAHALNEALEHLLVSLKVSRAYIFENYSDPNDGLCTHITHEVCAEGVSREINNPDLQHIPLAKMGFERWVQELSQGRPIVGLVKDFPELERALLEAQSIQAILVLPIRAESRWYGFIGFDDLRQRRWSDEDIRILKTSADMVGTYIAQKQALEKIEDHQEKLRSLTVQMARAEESERRRIATILHDQVGQLLAVSNMKLGSIKHTIPSDISCVVNEVQNLIRQADYFTQSLTHQLSPPVLYELGLEAAIQWLLEGVEKEHALEVVFTNDHWEKPLDNDRRTLLFQAVQELIHNTIKHAHAHTIKINITRESSFIDIFVEDDGIGFDTALLQTYDNRDSGFGLFNIRERFDHMGCRFSIDSCPGKGTRIHLSAPLSLEKERR